MALITSGCNGKIQSSSNASTVSSAKGDASSSQLTHKLLPKLVRCTDDSTAVLLIDSALSSEDESDSLLTKMFNGDSEIRKISTSKDGGTFKVSPEGVDSQKVVNVGIHISCGGSDLDSVELFSVGEIFDIYQCDAEDEKHFCADSKNLYPRSVARKFSDSLSEKFKNCSTGIAPIYFPKIGQCLDSLQYVIISKQAESQNLPMRFVRISSEL